MSTTIYLVRHAQALPLPSVREPEWELSERGRAQAEALVQVLLACGIEAVYTSPFRRSVATLRPFAAAAELPLQVDEGLRERCLSDEWIGDFREVWRRSWEDLTYALPGGESSQTCRTRMCAAVESLARRHCHQTIAIGSHGYAIGLLLTTLDPRFGGAEASGLRTPELLRLHWSEDGLAWDRTFVPGADFDRIATHFRHTPGIVA